MTIDIIIPIYKPDQRLRTLLSRLRQQSVKTNRIILMNTVEDEKYLNRMTSIDLNLIKGFKGVEVHDLPKSEFDHGATRNLGTTFSDADVFVCMTQDALPANRQLLKNLVQPILSGEADVSYARQLAAKDCRELERYTRDFNYPKESRLKTKEDLPELGIKTFFCSNVCAAYKRSVYNEAGGFIKRTIFNEDMILAGQLIDAGKTIAYAADACVIHSHNYTGLQQFHRNFDLAVSQADHPEIFADVPSEGEGIRLVMETAKYCISTGKTYLIAELIWKSGWKFLGYQLGKRYKKLPKKMVMACTMNPSYWEGDA